MARSLENQTGTGVATTTMQSSPTTHRQDLIEKAQSLDPSLETNEKGSYAPKATWSNRLGTVLTPVSVPGVYTADRPFLWNRIDVGSRMTVICLPGNKLWIHSPIELDDLLKEALEKLGKVTHVVSPNYEHVKFAKQWSEAYPDAGMWACPGMAQREPQVPWKGEIPSRIRPNLWSSPSNAKEKEVNNPQDSDLPAGFWDTNEIQSLHVDCEVNPFNGKPFFNEVIFYHSRSKTSITTDFFWNYPKGDGVTNSNYKQLCRHCHNQDFGVWELAPKVKRVPWGSRLWKCLMDRIYHPFYMGKMIPKDKKQDFNEIVDFVSNGGWDVETIVPAHGDVVRGKDFIQTVLKKHFNLS